MLEFFLSIFFYFENLIGAIELRVKKIVFLLHWNTSRNILWIVCAVIETCFVYYFFH